ncbi:MAG: TraR/DksA family transcriptional regulator [Candidatus Omnitrophota bacterium]
MKRKFAKKDLDNYRDKLLDLKDDYMNQIRDNSQDTLMKSQKDMSGDMSGYSIHIADVASDNYERDFNIGLVSIERRIVMDIDEALKRIEDKDYGNCEECKKPIAKIRLNAIPYTCHCKKCQEKMEKENKPR